MNDNAPPSIDPADSDGFLGAMRLILRKFTQGLDDMLPARVVAFNGDRNNPRVTVQPMVSLITTDKRTVGRAQIAQVPVLQIGAGGFLLSFPIKPGDLGWIKASDRDISLFLQNYAAGPPNTERLHTFEDAVFIPDVMRGYSIAGEDAANVVLQTNDGTVKVSLGASTLKMITPGCVLSMGGGSVAITAATSISLAAPAVTTTAAAIAQVGTVAQTGGNATMTGSLTTAGEVTAQGIPLSTHVHGGVAIGGANTAGPHP